MPGLKQFLSKEYRTKQHTIFPNQLQTSDESKHPCAYGIVPIPENTARKIAHGLSR